MQTGQDYFKSVDVMHLRIKQINIKQILKQKNQFKFLNFKNTIQK